jgi:peptidoglycan DL-endopeptidase LytF
MKISKRDTIIIAVLVNLALISILFALGIRSEEKGEEKVAASPQTKSEEIVQNSPTAQKIEKSTTDEIDQVLEEYALRQKVVASPKPEKEERSGDFYDVTVKKGDVLSKIAKSHGVKVEEIMNVNALHDAKLKIGQHLKVPKKDEEKEEADTEKVAALPEEKKESESEPSYYIVKSGDSPWKIARKCNVKYEDILLLNDLDQDKAKNLKVGQKIRIR